MIKDLNYEDILPAKGVGKIKLGMRYDDIINLLKEFYNANYKEIEYENNYLIKTSNIGIILSKLKIVNEKSVPLKKEEIVVSRVVLFNNFKGKLFGKIGIGSTLTDVSKYIGEWFDDDYDDGYELKDYPGIAFFLKDIGKDIDDDVWDDWTYPIESISIYPKDFYKGWFNVEVIREGKK